MNKFTEISAFALLTVGLAACAGSASSSMNAGERISARGGEIAQFGDAWMSGNKDVRNGEKMIAKSNDQIVDARKQLAKAEAAQSKALARITQAEQDNAKARQMISDGTNQMQRSEAEYAATRKGPAAINFAQPE